MTSPEFFFFFLYTSHMWACNHTLSSSSCIHTLWLNAHVQSSLVSSHSHLWQVTWDNMGEGGHMILLQTHRAVSLKMFYWSGWVCIYCPLWEQDGLMGSENNEDTFMQWRYLYSLYRSSYFFRLLKQYKKKTKHRFCQSSHMQMLTTG